MQRTNFTVCCAAVSCKLQIRNIPPHLQWEVSVCVCVCVSEQ
uniref:Uncharacterized protein n=1 Tax=Denticeps clupeoides TaxID=299321 RepID=A0AAY4BFS2_9TELE